jgi:uncharacterized protein (DUF1697 family)
MMHVALLRAVNVAGHGTVSTAQLKAVMEGAGLKDGRTLLQSGNLVFRAEGLGDAEIERRLEAEAERRLGLRTQVMARSGPAWRGVVEKNPFPAEAKADPAHLLVLALKSAPSTGDVDALRKGHDGPERFEAQGAHLYVVYPQGVGRSRLTTALIERRLGVAATGRNWNTTLKLADLVSG